MPLHERWCLALATIRKYGFFREPTSGLLRTAYPCSSYEFACVHTSPSYCVRKSCLFRRFWVVGRYRFVHSVLVRNSPVAVRVAVHVWPAIRARDEVCGVGPGTTEVGVGRLPRSLKELIVGRHSRCDVLPLLALDTAQAAPPLKAWI
jgi:hypothetical protein